MSDTKDPISEEECHRISTSIISLLINYACPRHEESFRIVMFAGTSENSSRVIDLCNKIFMSAEHSNRFHIATSVSGVRIANKGLNYDERELVILTGRGEFGRGRLPDLLLIRKCDEQNAAILQYMLQQGTGKIVYLY